MKEFNFDKFDELLKELRNLLPNPDKFIIAIDGFNGTGKTILSCKIAAALFANVINLDDFLVENIAYKITKIIYHIFVGLLLAFTFLNLFTTYIGIGRGFDKELNYWYWNLDKEASDWGMVCEGEWKFLIGPR